MKTFTVRWKTVEPGIVATGPGGNHIAIGAFEPERPRRSLIVPIKKKHQKTEPHMALSIMPHKRVCMGTYPGFEHPVQMQHVAYKCTEHANRPCSALIHMAFFYTQGGVPVQWIPVPLPVGQNCTHALPGDPRRNCPICEQRHRFRVQSHRVKQFGFGISRDAYGKLVNERLLCLNIDSGILIKQQKGAKLFWWNGFNLLVHTHISIAAYPKLVEQLLFREPPPQTP
ncbi:hypothetical protein GF380_03820 [Candidatus Uhrbacteria bacterium]|nr:hypothetical protein [Candidatus Uhrbacteria bacterium]